MCQGYFSFKYEYNLAKQSGAQGGLFSGSLQRNIAIPIRRRTSHWMHSPPCHRCFQQSCSCLHLYRDRSVLPLWGLSPKIKILLVYALKLGSWSHLYQSNVKQNILPKESSPHSLHSHVCGLDNPSHQHLKCRTESERHILLLFCILDITKKKKKKVSFFFFFLFSLSLCCRK